MALDGARTLKHRRPPARSYRAPPYPSRKVTLAVAPSEPGTIWVKI